ncbi:glycosyltransferase family 4 protein [Georgenia sp.]
MSLTLLAGFPEHLARTGWDVHVVSAPGPRLDALRRTPGVSVHPIKMARNPSLGADLKALVAWIRVLRDVRPDLVSVGTPKAGLLGGLAAFLTRVPHRVYMLRGLRYETARGFGRQLLVTMERLSVACAHRVIAVSDSLRRVAVQDRLGSAKKFEVVGAGSSNGVDVDRFATTSDERASMKADRWPDSPEIPVLGFIGRVHPDKGLELLADAARELARRRVPGRLLVVGGHDDPEGAWLIERLVASGWQVEIIGPVDDVVPWLKRMDVLCLPTYREGFPNVVLEAAAAGIPTVATLATGVVDAIEDQETGLVCVDRDPFTLADALESVLTDSTLRQELGGRAKGRARTSYDRSHVWELYAGCYQSMIYSTEREGMEDGDNGS